MESIPRTNPTFTNQPQAISSASDKKGDSTWNKIKEVTVLFFSGATELSLKDGASLLSRRAVALFLDLTILPLGLCLTGIAAAIKPNFDPTHPKRNQPPILLLHGSSFNDTEWLLGRAFLKKERYGSVYSVNYDGLLSNDPKMGIDDYAQGKVRQKILQIQKETGQKTIFLIGHSMGGLIAGYYAENYAKSDGISVRSVITIGTPWHGAPPLSNMKSKTKRHTQMTPGDIFLKTLVKQCLKSHHSNQTSYHSISSEVDLLVPGKSGLLSDKDAANVSKWSGHYSSIASPSTWNKITSILDRSISQISPIRRKRQRK